MIEALCGLKSDWTEGLTLEKSYRFKGDAMPREFFFGGLQQWTGKT